MQEQKTIFFFFFFSKKLYQNYPLALSLKKDNVQLA